MKKNIIKCISGFIVFIIVLLSLSFNNVYASSLAGEYKFIDTIYYTSDIGVMEALSIAKPYLLTKNNKYCNEKYDVILEYNNETKRYYYKVTHPNNTVVYYYNSPIPVNSNCGSYVMCLDFTNNSTDPTYGTIIVNNLNKGKKVSDCFIEGWSVEYGHLVSPIIDDVKVLSPKDNIVEQTVKYTPYSSADLIDFRYVAINKNQNPGNGLNFPLFDKTNLLSLKSFVGTPIGITLVSVSTIVGVLLLYKLIKFLIEFYNWLRPKEGK